MDINPNEVVTKEVVGKSKNDNIFYCTLVGGLHLIIKGSANPVVLGMGSHRAVAKKVAQMKDPEISFDFGELSKNEIINGSFFDLLVEKYSQLTDKINNKK